MYITYGLLGFLQQETMVPHNVLSHIIHTFQRIILLNTNNTMNTNKILKIYHHHHKVYTQHEYEVKEIILIVLYNFEWKQMSFCFENKILNLSSI